MTRIGINSRMRIAIIAPYSTGPLRGNITTVRRIARALERAGAETLLLALDAVDPVERERRLRSFAPHILHAFHAGYCGETALRLARGLGVPFAITITGTDLDEPRLRALPGTRRALEGAGAVVCFDGATAGELASHFPALAGRTTVIPQGVEPLPAAGRLPLDLAEDAFVLLLPAALREVKRVEFPLAPLAPLAERLPSLRYLIAGGALDAEYAARVERMLTRTPFATWLGELSVEGMGALYRRADLVLNCSLSERMPNSLLEAMALARPVLAADIPGNRSLVRHNLTGWLYRGEDEFRGLVASLAGDATLRGECGRRAREYVQSHHSPRREAHLHLALYGRLVARGI